MGAFRSENLEKEDTTISRNKNFEFIDYAKKTVKMQDEENSYAALRLWH